MKRILAFALSLVCCLCLLVGCGDSKKPTADTKPTTATTQNVKQEKQNNINNKQAVNNNTANANKLKISANGTYTDKDHVAAYINEFKRLPSNYITKNDAKKLGWQTKGTLDKVAPGKSIGGDRYGDYEGKLPKGHSYKECDIDYVKGNRNAKRIIFSNDGLIFYTSDHYKSFTKLYEGGKKL